MSDGIFTASNGSQYRTRFGQLETRGRAGAWVFLAGADLTDSLRQFFRDEWDQGLGRVRYPEQPTYVIYPDPTGDSVLVLRELDGLTVRFAAGFTGTATNFERAAKWWFDSHPELCGDVLHLDGEPQPDVTCGLLATPAHVWHQSKPDKDGVTVSWTGGEDPE